MAHQVSQVSLVPAVHSVVGITVVIAHNRRYFPPRATDICAWLPPDLRLTGQIGMFMKVINCHLLKRQVTPNKAHSAITACPARAHVRRKFFNLARRILQPK